MKTPSGATATGTVDLSIARSADVEHEASNALHPAAAAVIGWAPFAIVDLAMSTYSEWGHPPLSRQLEHLLFNLGNTLAAGAFAAGLVLAARLGKRRLPKLSPAVSLLLDFVGLAIVAVVLSYWIARPDFEILAHRKASRFHVSPSTFLDGATLVVGVGLAAAVPVGRLLARLRLRTVGVALAFGMAVLNFRFLLSDYWGLHLSWVALSAVLAGASLAGAALPAWLALPRWAKLPPLLALGGLAMWSVVVPPAPGLVARLLRTYATPFTPLFIRWGYRGHEGAAVVPPDQRAWFSRRDGLDPIASTTPPSDASNAIVLMLTMDSFRAEMLESRKYDEAMPTLAKMRDEGVHFANAYSPGTQTLYTLPSWFTGKYFSQLYWSRVGGSLFPTNDATERFPALLAEGKVESWDIMPGNWFSPHHGLATGFSKYVNLRKGGRGSDFARGREVTRALLRRLKQHGAGPLYVFAHFMDAHHPYSGVGQRGSQLQTYLREIRVLDRQIANIRNAVDALGFTSRTTYILSADHGDSFGEHGTHGHGRSVYNELARVPLVISGPRFSKRTVDELVTTLDLAPTILDLFGVDTPPTMMGESLVPVLRGGEPHFTRPIVIENRLRQAMVFPNGVKISRDLHFGSAEAYDLNTDPLELDNRVDDPTFDTSNQFALLKAFFDAQTYRTKRYKPPYRR